MPDFSAVTQNATDAMGTALSMMKDAFFSSEYGQDVQSMLYDMMICWPVLLIASGAAVILSYIFLFVMRCVGGAIVWLMILLAQASLILGGLYCWWLTQNKYTPEDSTYKGL